MTPPTLTHNQFAVLSVLLDGQPHRGTSIARSIEFHRVLSITSIFRPLSWNGLMERVRWQENGEAVVGYRITENGRRAWLEAADFYSYFVERFGKPRPRAPGPSVTVLTPLGTARPRRKTG
jgi:DNA-binding MarR family transcriptional regulator